MDAPVKLPCAVEFKKDRCTFYDFTSGDREYGELRRVCKGSEIEDALLHDDANKFVRVINGEVKVDGEVPEDLFHMIFEFDAANCLKAALENKTKHYFDIYAHPWFAGCTKLPLLHLASYYSSVEIIKLLLDLQAEYAPGVDDGCDGGEFFDPGTLPLEEALECTRLPIALRKDLDLTDPKGSVFRIIHRLCLQDKRRPLEVVRLLAQRSKKVKDVFIKSLDKGIFGDVTALLMVADEKVMPCKVNHGEIQDYVAEKVATLAALQSIPCTGTNANINDDALKKLKNKELVMATMLVLFDIFETIGHVFRGFLLLDPETDADKVAAQIGCLFKTAGLHIDDKYVRGFQRSSSYDEMNLSRGVLSNSKMEPGNLSFLCRMERKMLEGSKQVIASFQEKQSPHARLGGHQAPFGISASYHTLCSTEGRKDFGSARLRKVGKMIPNIRINQFAFFMTTFKRVMRHI